MIARATLSRSLLAAQLVAVIGGFAMLAFAAPAEGRMLLVPVGPAASARLISVALANGALIVDRGPIPGSLVVDGTRTRLAGGFGWTDIVILAAPQSGCGGVERT